MGVGMLIKAEHADILVTFIILMPVCCKSFFGAETVVQKCLTNVHM